MNSEMPSQPAEDERFAKIIAQLGSYKTIGQMVYEVLKEAILTGAFSPGESLRQESLAEAIGVSRIPVRSALLQLEAEGLVTFHPHRGAKVRTLTTDQIDEIYRLRALLECHALEISIPAMTADRVATLQELADELDKQAPGNEFVDVRVRFYRELYDVRRNPLLVQVIEELRSRVGRYLLSFRFDSAHDHEHGELVSFIADGDVAGAQEWMKGHLEGVRRGIEGLAGGYDAEPDVGGGRPKKRVAKTRSHVAIKPSRAAGDSQSSGA